MANNTRYKELPEFEEEFDEDDFYDADGNHSPGGLYDAGGHIVGDRWADYADDLRDRIRDDSY